MKKSAQIIISIIVLAAVGGGAFYGGIWYKGSQAVAQKAGFSGTRIGGRFAAGNNFVTGQIITKDEQSITIKDRNGSSRIIFYSNSTDVGKFVAGNVTDLTVGNTVMINGKTNTDGSITAQSIQIRPAVTTNRTQP